ncbi:MAG TPA: hypothetical protein VNO70_26735 [Blastocatellia bacterium]|nr:hypothetical protein [Blastocatellia bacterium]
MGGYGSTRWGWHTGKTAVEECYALDINHWMREGLLQAGGYKQGGWQWQNAVTGKQLAAIGYAVSTVNPSRAWARLIYTFIATGERFDYKVALTTTRPHFGGRRWWFVCPLCARRVGKLYLPPGGRYFGCRHCHDLTYRSCLESDSRVGRLRRDPQAFLSLLTKSPQDLSASEVMLILKARERGRRGSSSILQYLAST